MAKKAKEKTEVITEEESAAKKGGKQEEVKTSETIKEVIGSDGKAIKAAYIIFMRATAIFLSRASSFCSACSRPARLAIVPQILQSPVAGFN